VSARSGLSRSARRKPPSLRLLSRAAFPLPGEVTAADRSYVAPVRNGLLPICAAILLLLPCSALASARIGMSPAESTLLREVNVARAHAGLAPLRVDARLETAARAHSREMLSTNTFAHGDFASRMLRYEITGMTAGENLAWGSGSSASAQAIVAAWLASPEHRANLLRGSFRRVGIGSLDGAFQGSREARVVTADFAG
jgi:hypothetical protein